MKNHLLTYLFLLLSSIIFAQYTNLDETTFLELNKLDDTISLNEGFDYELVNVGVMHFTNLHRTSKRKRSLTYDKILEDWAFLHSSEMKKHHFFDHINRRNRLIRDIDDRADYVHYDKYVELAENLYYGFVDLRNLPTYRELAQRITKAFIDSKHHNANLLNKNVEEMGGFIVFKDKSEDGFLYYYFTQSFGARYDTNDREHKL